MKKVFTLLTLALLAIGNAWGANITASTGTWPDANCLVLDNAVTQNGAITFTAQKKENAPSYANATTKFNGNAFTKGAKMEADTQISFETTGVATITIVQGLYDTGNKRTYVGINFDNTAIRSQTNCDYMTFRTYSNVNAAGIVNASANTSSNQEVRIYKLYNVPVGTHTIKKGPDCQTVITYVGVTYETTTKNTISTAMDNAGESTVSGGGSYWPNDSVILTATPVSKAFTKWVKSSNSSEFTINPLIVYADAAETYTAYFEDATTHTITSAIADGQSSFGTITNEGDNDVIEDESITLTATANTGYAFVNWTKGGDVYSTEASITIISSEDNAGTYIANFKQLYTITYAAGSGSFGTTNTIALTDYANSNNQAMLWSSNNYIGYNGYTQTGWSDGTNTYNLGETATVTGNTTMTAVFEENTASLSRNISTNTITWNFNRSSASDPTYNIEGRTGYFVVQTTVNGSTIDVPMLIDATGTYVDAEGKTRSAKFYNVGRVGNGTQINISTKLTIPAVSGMAITLETTGTNYKITNATTIAGANDFDISADKTTATYTYTGSAATIDIILNDGGYWKRLAVTYPKTATYVDVTSAGYRTFASSSALDFTGGVTGLKAYKATVASNTVSFSEIDCAVPASTGMLLKAEEGRYYIPLASDTPDAIDNAFVGVTAASEQAAGIYVLMNGAQGVGFYKTGNAFTVGANTAYLPASIATAKSFIGFDDEAMGISDAVQLNSMENKAFSTLPASAWLSRRRACTS